MPRFRHLLPLLAWQLPLGRLPGVPLSAHWSFFCLLAWEFSRGWRRAGWSGGWLFVGFTLLLFACVVLHELGHVAAARLLGIRTRGIVLLSIGAGALLERMPRQPLGELFVALAGPTVNFVLAAVLLPLQAALASQAASDGNWDWAGLVRILVRVNLILACFNLLPVFPMDGGRVLRALLALRWPRLRATRLALLLTRGVAAAAIVLLVGNGQSVLHVVLFAAVLFLGELEYRSERESDVFIWPRATVALPQAKAETSTHPASTLVPAALPHRCLPPRGAPLESPGPRVRGLGRAWRLGAAASRIAGAVRVHHRANRPTSNR